MKRVQDDASGVGLRGLSFDVTTYIYVGNVSER